MKIKFDKRNYRKHNDKNKELINKSLKECGAGRSIVIDNEDNIIAGNGIYEQAQKLGIKPRIIETDGSELVVVKRTDLATDDDKRKQLAVMDNSSSDSSEFDFELLNEDFDTEILLDWGVDINLDDNIIETFSDTNSVLNELDDLRGLIYEPTGEKPNITELYNIPDKVKDFEKNILNSKLNNDEKDFCLKALTRFYRFNFRNIAEYYAQSSSECKKIFEELILVIPDGEKILRNQLLELDKTINEIEDENE